MDYRIGITGAQGSGKQPRKVYRRALRDSVCGCWRRRTDDKAWSQRRRSMPLFERLQVQMEVARHIELVTRGAEGFVIDRTPADVMAYTLDLVGQTNDQRCIDLALEIERFAIRPRCPILMPLRGCARAW